MVKPVRDFILGCDISSAGGFPTNYQAIAGKNNWFLSIGSEVVFSSILYIETIIYKILYCVLSHTIYYAISDYLYTNSFSVNTCKWFYHKHWTCVPLTDLPMPSSGVPQFGQAALIGARIAQQRPQGLSRKQRPTWVRKMGMYSTGWAPPRYKLVYKP